MFGINDIVMAIYVIVLSAQTSIRSTLCLVSISMRVIGPVLEKKLVANNTDRVYMLSYET
jgi:hypothetical protein